MRWLLPGVRFQQNFYMWANRKAAQIRPFLFPARLRIGYQWRCQKHSAEQIGNSRARNIAAVVSDRLQRPGNFSTQVVCASGALSDRHRGCSSDRSDWSTALEKRWVHGRKFLRLYQKKKFSCCQTPEMLGQLVSKIFLFGNLGDVFSAGKCLYPPDQSHLPPLKVSYLSLHCTPHNLCTSSGVKTPWNEVYLYILEQRNIKTICNTLRLHM